MKIKGVTEEQIIDIAQSLGFRCDNQRHEGRYFLFVLRMATGLTGRPGKRPPGATRYRKKGYSRHAWGKGPEYAQGAVCFHGHKRFMEMIFAINPEATIRTAKAAYLGLESFKSQFDRVGDSNVGSQMYPLIYRDACDCDESDEHETTFGTLHPDGSLTNVRKIKASALRGCPFTIFVADHYREDGTCKCNDPKHREMMKREWKYTDEDFRRAGVIP